MLTLSELDVQQYEDELAKLREEVETLKKGYEAAMKIVRSTYPDKFPDTYFICGEGGEKDNNGLPDRVLVCPAYGADWFEVYERAK
jgi:hypothetical protein